MPKKKSARRKQPARSPIMPARSQSTSATAAPTAAKPAPTPATPSTSPSTPPSPTPLAALPTLTWIAEPLRPLAEPIDSLHLDPKNARQHDEANIKAISTSLRRFGQRKPIVVNRKNGQIEAGNGTLVAAKRLGWSHLAVVWVEDDLAAQAGFSIADNRTAELATWDSGVLAELVEKYGGGGEGKGGGGGGEGAAELFDDLLIGELIEAVNGKEELEDARPQIDRAEELQKQWGTATGQLWEVPGKAGVHRVLCGDCRDAGDVARLCVEKVNGCFTSPPYAEQRKEQYGGVPAAEYVDWWEAVQANVRSVLAEDGSFFVNIKPHCEDGERVLYVFDLVLAMKRQWGWRYVDELSWCHQGMPGVYGDRFKNQFEPCFHFSPGKCKTRFDEVASQSENVPTSSVGSNAEMHGKGDPLRGRQPGRALPGNIISVGLSSSSIGRTAAFPVGLPSFFIKAFSDPGDRWLDPFLGSFTTIVACENLGRVGMGIEISPAYIAAGLERLKVMGLQPILSAG